MATEPPSARVIDLFAALSAALKPKPREKMDARRHQTETAETTADTTTAPAKPKRERGTTTAGVKAGQLFEKLLALDEEELAELAASPADIRAKFEARRAKAMAESSDDVRKLVEKLRAP